MIDTTDFFFPYPYPNIAFKTNPQVVRDTECPILGEKNKKPLNYCGGPGFAAGSVKSSHP